MAFNKLATISALLAIVGCAAAVEYVELNDANQAILNLDLSKSLKVVQEALKSGYKFEKVADAMSFLKNCKWLQSSMDSKVDSDYQGLAGKIKAILAEESLAGVCKVGVSKLTHFASMDEKLGEFAYLSKKKLEEINTLKSRLAEHPHIKTLLSHLFDQLTGDLSERLLAGAARDAAAFFDETLPQGALDFETKYKTGCQISVLKPICKLVRRSSDNGVSAIGADFKDFAQITLKDQAQLSAHEAASGVNLDELRLACANAKGNLSPFEMVDLYEQFNMLSQDRIKEAAKKISDFGFFHEMYHMCLAAEKQ